jgi:hypothetical protein
MIKFEACEPFEAEVWDIDESRGNRVSTVVGFIEHCVLTNDDRGDIFVKFKHYKKIEPEYVPLDSVHDIPRWCVGLWVDYAGHNKETRLLRLYEDTIFLGVEAKHPSDGEPFSLQWACDNRMEVVGWGGTFKFYREKP